MANLDVDSGGGTSAAGYTSAVDYGWLGGASDVTQGTDGSGRKYGIVNAASSAGPGIYKLFASGATEIFMGIRCWLSGTNMNPNALFGLVDGSGNGLAFIGHGGTSGGDANKIVVVQNGGSVVADYAFTAVDMESPTYIEAKFYGISGGACSVDVRIAGSVVISAASVTLSPSTFAGYGIGYPTEMAYFDSNLYVNYQDMYVNDATGSLNNTYNGVSFVGCAHPSAAGQSTLWTPSTGSNWSAVNTINPSGTPNVQSSTVGNLDTYEQSGLAVGLLGVQAVKLNVDAEYVNGAVGISPVLGNGSTEVVGTQFSPGASFSNNPTIYNENPITSAAWALADFNTLQIGIKQTA